MTETARRLCPSCQQYFAAPAGRAHCSGACRMADWRRRHPDHQPPNPTPTPPPDVYICTRCQRRYQFHQPALATPAPNCPHCAIPTRRLGVGGHCPCCDQPVAAIELLDNQEVTDTTA
jgi:hypothetical protein